MSEVIIGKPLREKLESEYGRGTHLILEIDESESLEKVPGTSGAGYVVEVFAESEQGSLAELVGNTELPEGSFAEYTVGQDPVYLARMIQSVRGSSNLMREKLAHSKRLESIHPGPLNDVRDTSGKQLLII